MRWLIALFITMFACTAVRAEVYEWVDGQGVVHFIDNPDKVPARYLKKVKTRESVSGERTNPAVSQQPAAPPAPPARKAELYGGHDESWWRTGFAALRGELKSIREKLPGKKETLVQLHRKWVISMGRTPKTGEKGESKFFKTPREGSEEVLPDDGFASSPLGGVGRNRAAYYALKAEIEGDEARLGEMEGRLAALESEAGRAGVPAAWRQ